jgi:cell division septation protein DedD
MKYTILLSALSISLVSAYFSIIGLTTMFPAAFWSIVIMGGVLEVGKLVSASWLHHNWKIAPRSLKIYLTTAVVVLIFITSMGIFGFLSKSHIKHQKDAQEVAILVTQLENKMTREKDYIGRQNEYIAELSSDAKNSTDKDIYNIELEQKKIDDLYSSLEKSISIDNAEITRLNDRIKVLNQEVATIEATSGGIFSNKKKKLEELEEKQKLERESIGQRILAAEARINKARESTEQQVGNIRERIDSHQDEKSNTQDLSAKKEEYNNNIKDAYSRIDDMESERFRLKNSQLELEAEVGPVKYVAELVEDFGFGSIDLGGAVRIVIVILVFVFDPLAVVMLLAANLSFRKIQSYESLSKQIKKRTPKLTTTTSTTTKKPTTTTQKPTTTTEKPTTTTEKPVTTTKKPVDTGVDVSETHMIKHNTPTKVTSKIIR